MPVDDFTDAERALADELHVDLDAVGADPNAEPGEPTEVAESGGGAATPRRRPMTSGRRL